MSTPYGFTSDLGHPGQIATLGEAEIRSLRNGESAAVPFGIAVKKGVADEDFKLLTSGTEDVVGVIAHSHAIDEFGLTDGQGIAAGRVGNVLTEGEVVVVVEEAVTPTDPVFVRFTATGDFPQVGGFRKSADTAKARRMFGARYLTSGGAGELVKLSFDVATEALSVLLTNHETRIAALE